MSIIFNFLMKLLWIIAMLIVITGSLWVFQLMLIEFINVDYVKILKKMIRNFKNDRTR